MPDTWDDWNFKGNLTVEDAGAGHGYAIVEGFSMFDSQKEAQEWIDKIIIMKNMYDEIMKEKEYIPQLEVVYQKAIKNG